MTGSIYIWLGCKKMTCDVVTWVELLKLVIEYEPSRIAYCLVSCTYVRCSCTVGVRVLLLFARGNCRQQAARGTPAGCGLRSCDTTDSSSRITVQVTLNEVTLLHPRLDKAPHNGRLQRAIWLCRQGLLFILFCCMVSSVVQFRLDWTNPGLSLQST
jgi:hypothetical protein